MARAIVPLAARLGSWIGSSRVLFLAVVSPLIVIYSLTATWVSPYHGDAMTNIVTAWYIGNTGSPIASEHGEVAVPEHRGNFVWIVPSPRGPVSQYPPGAALLAAPLYAISGQPMEMTEQVGANRPDLPPVEFPMPPIWPAAVTAVLATSLAMGFLALALVSIGSRVEAWAAAIVTGLGTSAWSVASDMFWQHGPAMMWIGAALYLTSRDRLAWAGVAFAFAIFTRPHTAVVAAAVGVALTLNRRSTKPVVAVGATSAMGLVGLLLFNRWVFGEWSVNGGYGTTFSDKFVSNGLAWSVQNVAGGLFDLRHGLIMWSPVLLVLAVGVVKGAKATPVWTTAAALGGVVYLLIQFRANRFSGGDGHFSYRYPLEAIVAWAPLLFAGYRARIAPNDRLNRMFWIAAVASILMHAVGAVFWPAILIE